MQLPPPLLQALTHKHNQPIPDGQRRMAMRCPIHMTSTTTKRKKTIAQKRRHPTQPQPLVCLRRRQQIPLGGAPRGAGGCAGGVCVSIRISDTPRGLAFFCISFSSIFHVFLLFLFICFVLLCFVLFCSV